MFEHFGIMDIFSTIKKYKITLSIITIFPILFFGFKGLKAIKNSFNNEYPKESSNVYLYTSSYHVEPIGEAVNYSKMDAGFYKSLPNDYVAMINSDQCMKYVYEKLLQSYSKEYIIQNSLLKENEDISNVDDLNISHIAELYEAKQYESTMLLNIYSVTYNEELSKLIADTCNSYIYENISKIIKHSKINSVGNTEQYLSLKQAQEELEPLGYSLIEISQPSTLKSIVKLLIKQTIIPIILIIALCLFIVFLIAFLNPVMNRKSDFNEYKIPVIGEIKNNGKIKEV